MARNLNYKEKNKKVNKKKIIEKLTSGKQNKKEVEETIF